MKIVCRQNMLSGKCSFCITGRPKKLVRMIKLFFGCFVSVWRNLLGLELKVTSNWMYEAVLCAASSYHGVIISYHIWYFSSVKYICGRLPNSAKSFYPRDECKIRVGAADVSPKCSPSFQHCAIWGFCRASSSLLVFNGFLQREPSSVLFCPSCEWQWPWMVQILKVALCSHGAHIDVPSGCCYPSPV